MKTKCVNNRNGYESSLTIGKEYDIVSIQPGTFAGDYYITVIGDHGTKASGYSTRFDLPKEQVKDAST